MLLLLVSDRLYSMVKKQKLFKLIDCIVFVYCEGTISGQLKSSSKLSVLYIDAHADINTNLTSRSGNIHGMDVAMIANEMTEYWKYLPGFEWQQKK